MDLLDRLLGHDAWTTARLLDLCRDLPDADLDRTFDVGSGSLRRTIDHIIRNMEAWTDQMEGRPVRDRTGTSAGDLARRLEIAARDLARLARRVREDGDWDRTWTDPDEHPPVARTFGGTIAHVLTHSMHHRAQLLFMLRRLGVQGVPEGDVLSWESQAGRKPHWRPEA